MMGWLLVATSAFALVLAAFALLTSTGRARWSGRTESLSASLTRVRRPIQPTVVDLRETLNLPLVVQRWFRMVLRDGQRMVHRVRLCQAGRIDLGQGKPRWCRFRATQDVSLSRPGFVWSARVRILPGCWAGVHDAYVAGKGVLHAALFGWLTVADSSASSDLCNVDLDEWLRFVAEAAWYPTALLPSQGARWTAVDDRSARVTLCDGSLEATMLFRFDDDCLIRTVRADARGRMVGRVAVPTAWEGRYWDYQERAGMRVPMQAEVGWDLDGAVRPYWRGQVQDLRFEFVGQGDET